MNDMKKMLQAIINGQSALKEELIKRIDRVDKGLRYEFGKRFDVLEKKVDENKRRLDKIGKQVAYLEDDTPTRKEHDKLEERVDKLEHQYATV